MTDAQDAANADERVARALNDENGYSMVHGGRMWAITWRAWCAGYEAFGRPSVMADIGK